MPSRTSTLSHVSRAKAISNALRSTSRRNLQTHQPQRCISQISRPSRATTFNVPMRTLHTTAAKRANVEASIPLTSMATDPMPSRSNFEPMPETTGTPVATISTTIQAPETPEPGTNENKPLVISKSLQQMLPALRAQKPHYITAHIHSFPYLLTEGDTLRLPFHMKGVNMGDVLRFNRATILGSRDFTLKAGTTSYAASNPQHVRGEDFTNKRRTGEPSYIDERLFECRMRVVGLDSTPVMITEKKKRRNRRTRTVKSKHKFTVLKVMEVRLKSLEEIMQTDGVQVVLE